MQYKIFAQIPAYRDPELPKTINHLLQNAKNPDQIKIGICHQYHDNDEYIKELNKLKHLHNIKMINIPYHKSRGLGWARSLTNNLFGDEKYYLQLDSHHRFAENWDEYLIDILESLNDEKAIVSGYPFSYKPEKELDKYVPSNERCLQNIVIKFVDTNNILQRRPEHIRHKESPFRAKFIAGGCLFTYGTFVNDVPSDPQIFFNEEVPMSVRAFTHGYNLYHPHLNVIWHEYVRKDKHKFWYDEETKKIHANLSKTTRQRIDKLLFNKGDVDLGKYGLGNVRSLDDYKAYAGIDFVNKIIHPDTLQHKESPIYDSTKVKKINKKKIEINKKIGDFRKRLNKLDDNTINFIDMHVLSIHNSVIHHKRYTHISGWKDKQTFNKDIICDEEPWKLCLSINVLKPTAKNFVFEYIL